MHAAAIGYIMLWLKIRICWPFLIDDTQRSVEPEFPGGCVNRNLAMVADLSAFGRELLWQTVVVAAKTTQRLKIGCLKLVLGMVLSDPVN